MAGNVVDMCGQACCSTARLSQSLSSAEMLLKDLLGLAAPQLVAGHPCPYVLSSPNPWGWGTPWRGVVESRKLAGKGAAAPAPCLPFCQGCMDRTKPSCPCSKQI